MAPRTVCTDLYVKLEEAGAALDGALEALERVFAEGRGDGGAAGGVPRIGAHPAGSAGGRGCSLGGARRGGCGGRRVAQPGGRRQALNRCSLAHPRCPPRATVSAAASSRPANCFKSVKAVEDACTGGCKRHGGVGR